MLDVSSLSGGGTYVRIDVIYVSSIVLRILRIQAVGIPGGATTHDNTIVSMTMCSSEAPNRAG